MPEFGFSSSATWTCPDHVFTVTVKLSGAGAGGALGGFMVGGGGGGGGEYLITDVPVTPGTVYTVNVGLGGIGGYPGGNPRGTDGGDTTFTPYQANAAPLAVGHGGKASTVSGKGGIGGQGAGSPGQSGQDGRGFPQQIGGTGGGNALAGAPITSSSDGMGGLGGQFAISGHIFGSDGIPGGKGAGGGGGFGAQGGSSVAQILPSKGGNGGGGFATLDWHVTPSQPPTAPTNVVARAGDSRAEVSWGSSFTNANTAAPTGYVVTASPGGITATTDQSHYSTTIFGLTNGTTYTFSVHATSSLGNTAESPPSNSVTPTPTASVTGTIVTGSVTPGDGGGPFVAPLVISKPMLQSIIDAAAKNPTTAGLPVLQTLKTFLDLMP